MNILCVGGAGYLGSRMVDMLHRRGLHPFVYDNLLYRPDYYDYESDFILGDVTDRIHLGLALKRYKIETVIWLAAIVGDAPCSIMPERATQVNVESVRWLRDNFGGWLIFPSSCSVYGVADGVATEDSPLIPQSLYAETKIRAEEILAGRPYTWVLRFGTLHGVSRRMRFDLVVNAMTRSAVLDNRVSVFGGKQRRPLLGVDDAARLMAQLTGENLPSGTYNVAGENLTIQEVGERVASVTGAVLEVSPSAAEDRRDYQVDTRRMREQLFFTPEYSVESSVRAIMFLLNSGRLRDPREACYGNATSLQGGSNG